MTTGLYLNLCKAVGLSLSELDELEYGLVMDMIKERGNDSYEYKYIATQEDFDKF